LFEVVDATAHELPGYACFGKVFARARKLLVRTGRESFAAARENEANLHTIFLALQRHNKVSIEHAAKLDIDRLARFRNGRVDLLGDGFAG
jgi:hypothetical protein